MIFGTMKNPLTGNSRPEKPSTDPSRISPFTITAWKSGIGTNITPSKLNKLAGNYKELIMDQADDLLYGLIDGKSFDGSKPLNHEIDLLQDIWNRQELLMNRYFIENM